MQLARALIIAVALALIACNPYDPNLVDQPFRCACNVEDAPGCVGPDEARCPDGYECITYSAVEEICEEKDSAPRADAGPDEIDAGPFECRSDLEPNDSITAPTVAPIPDFGDDYELVGLQICPDTDKDIFRFRTDVVGKNVTVTLTHRSDEGLLSLDILNSGGVSIRTGVPTGDDDDVLEAAVQNLPVGTYYAQVAASAAGVENDFDIYILTTGP